MNKIIISIDPANSITSQNGNLVYDVKANSILIWNGNQWEYVLPEDKFERRKRIVSKLLGKK